jgi:SLT domain-containing protein
VGVGADPPPPQAITSARLVANIRKMSADSGLFVLEGEINKERFPGDHRAAVSLTHAYLAAIQYIKRR